MGRGRAKAKQTKVARELKYTTHETDLERLQRELASSSGDGPTKGDSAKSTNPRGPDDGPDDDDRWAASER